MLHFIHLPHHRYKPSSHVLYLQQIFEVRKTIKGILLLFADAPPCGGTVLYSFGVIHHVIANGASMHLKGSFTFALLIKISPLDVTYGGYPFQFYESMSNRGVRFYIRGNHAPRIFIRDTDKNDEDLSGVPLKPSQWSFLAIVYDYDTAKYDLHTHL